MSPVGGGRDKRDRDEGEPQDVLAEIAARDAATLLDPEYVVPSDAVDTGTIRAYDRRTLLAALVRTPETLDATRERGKPSETVSNALAASPAPDPGVREGLADVAAGRVKPWSEVRARLAPSAEPPETT